MLFDFHWHLQCCCLNSGFLPSFNLNALLPVNWLSLGWDKKKIKVQDGIEYRRSSAEKYIWPVLNFKDKMFRPSASKPPPPNPKAVRLWLISATSSECRCSAKKKRFRVHVPPSVLCHHLSYTLIPTSLAHSWGREQSVEPPPHQRHEPSTLCLSEAAYSASQQRCVCSLNGPADNQGLNTLSAFWEIWSRRCRPVRSIHGDKSCRRTELWGSYVQKHRLIEPSRCSWTRSSSTT